MKQGETMKNREKERGILGRLRMQLIMGVMGGGMMLAVGAASSSLVVTITPSPSGLIAVGDTNAFLVASAICSGTNVTTNSTTYSWAGGGITNTSIQSITTLGETNISLTATHIYTADEITYTNTGTTNISVTIVGISNIIGATNVLAGSTNNYTVTPEGGSTFPSGWPKWETNGTAMSGTTASNTVVFPTNAMSNFTVTATVGTSTTNLNVNVIKVDLKVEEIHFNHNTGSHSSDALNIRENKTTPITVPEYVKGGQNKPAAYVKNTSVKIKAKFSVTPTNISRLKIRAKSTDTDSSLGDLTEKTVNFSNGESQLEEFTVSGNTPNKVYKSTESWDWEVTQVDGVSVAPAALDTTSGHVVYTVYQAPSSPWSNTANNDQNAWTSALEFAIVTCNASGKTDEHAILTSLRSAQEIPYQGSPFYTSGSHFELTDYMNLSSAGNCLDSAQGLFISARLLGVNANAISRKYFFGYNHHCYVEYNNYAYDSCKRMQNSIDDFHDSGVSLSSNFHQYLNIYINGILHGYDYITNGNTIIESTIPVWQNQWNPTTFE